MKLLAISTTLLALGFALCGTVQAQDQQKPKTDAAAMKNANAKIVGPLDKSATDTPTGKKKNSVKPAPKSSTVAAKGQAAKGQGGAVMMKEKVEPPPQKDPKGGGSGPKDPKPKKGMVIKDQAAMKLAPGQSQK
jgi:hypothetical protein